MQSGTRPAQHLHKIKTYPHFGAIASADIPDFDFGKNLPLQDQDHDNAPYECVGYTAAHILHSIFNLPFSPDFSYAAARYVSGDGPEGTPGTSFHGGMDALVALGGLVKGLAIQDAESFGEKAVSDWNAWSAGQKSTALKQSQNGVRNVLGFGDAFDSILSALNQGGIPISLGSPWFPSFQSGIDHGIVSPPDPSKINGLGWHAYTADGKVTLAGVPHLIIYSHQGNRVGDGGKLYFSRETINRTLSVPGSGALTIDKGAIRWIALVGILVRRFPALLSDLPALIKAGLLRP